MESKINTLTAVQVIELIRKGEITAAELMRSCIGQIECIEKDIKAWAYFDGDYALQQSEKIDNKIKKQENIGYLYGVPVGIKDIFNTTGMPTCMGSSIWKGFTPGNDARAIDYIRWADGIIAGKTVTAEFAVHHPGPTVNPHDFEYSPGTSSSGSAAAVASFMVPLALGTQTAGSTIRPASYCGIFGMKPSFGLIPRTGILKTLDTLDHVSFLSRSVDDLKLMLDSLRVKGPNYPYVHKNIDNPLEKKSGEKNNWNVAFVRTPAWDCAEEYAKKDIIDFAVKLGQDSRVIVEEVDLPVEFNLAHDIHELIYTKALSYYFQDEYENHKEKISETFREMVEEGGKISTDKYMKGLEDQKILISQFDKFMSGYDIVLTLSTSGDAPKGIFTRDRKDSCLIWTLCHAPAISMPVFRSPVGLPFGAQIISQRYNDYNLLKFARFLKERGFVSNIKT